MSPSSTLPPWLAQGFERLQAGDIDGYVQMYAKDAVHEFPFAAAGGVSRLTGRDEIAAYMRHLPKLMRFGALNNVRNREVADEFIIEAEGNHRRVSDDQPLRISYVWFITVQECQVTHFRDYMNAVQLSV